MATTWGGRIVKPKPVIPGSPAVPPTTAVPTGIEAPGNVEADPNATQKGAGVSALPPAPTAPAPVMPPVQKPDAVVTPPMPAADPFAGGAGVSPIAASPIAPGSEGVPGGRPAPPFGVVPDSKIDPSGPLSLAGLGLSNPGIMSPEMSGANLQALPGSTKPIADPAKQGVSAIGPSAPPGGWQPTPDNPYPWLKGVNAGAYDPVVSPPNPSDWNNKSFTTPVGQPQNEHDKQMIADGSWNSAPKPTKPNVVLWDGVPVDQNTGKPIPYDASQGQGVDAATGDVGIRMPDGSFRVGATRDSLAAEAPDLSVRDLLTGEMRSPNQTFDTPFPGSVPRGTSGSGAVPNSGGSSSPAGTGAGVSNGGNVPSPAASATNGATGNQPLERLLQGNNATGQGAVSTTPTDPMDSLLGKTISAGPLSDPVAQAQAAWETFRQSSDPAYQASLRDANRYAAASGSLGSGMLNTSLGDLFANRANNLDVAKQSLLERALDTANNNVWKNVDQANNQQVFQQGLQRDAYNQGSGATALGYQGNPAETYMAMANLYGANSAQAQAALQALIQGTTAKNTNQSTLDQFLKSLPPGTLPRTPAPNTAAPIDTSSYARP